MNNYLFIVEGSHDSAFIGRILKDFFKYKKVNRIGNLSEFGKSLLPVDFPFKDDSLDIFNVVPTFFSLGDNEICCKVAHGQDNLLSTLNDILVETDRINLQDLKNIVIFADADTFNKDEKIKYLKDIISKNNFTYFNYSSFNNDIIKINSQKIIIDVPIFVFPNNQDPGSIEDSIIENLTLTNSDLLNKYTNLIDSVKTTWNSDNSKREKAIIGGIGNIYEPGLSNVVIIGSEKFKWINKTNSIGGIPELVTFFKNIGL